MSKRARSPSLHLSSASFASSRPQLPHAGFQLLQGLPAFLLSTVCSYLPVYQVVCIVRSTCRAVHSNVMAGCLQRSHLLISSTSLPSLVASRPSTHALISRIESLSLLYLHGVEDESLNMAMLPLAELRSPHDASRFLFSSLSSLYVAFDTQSQRRCPKLLGQGCLLSLLLLLAAHSDSFSSLRRLHIDDSSMTVVREVELSFSSLARLQLTHCRIQLRQASALSCSSLLQALSSMQSLTFLDLGETLDAWPKLLQLLCAPATIPLLLRLRALVLPPSLMDDDGLDGLHNAFLCRLSSLPAPPALQHFSGVTPVSHRAPGLLSLFSLPHLSQLQLNGHVRRSEFLAFTSRFTAAPAPLVSLVLPSFQFDPGDFGRQGAAVAEDAAAVSSAVRQLLAGLPTLRRLQCEAETVTGVFDGERSCSSRLYSLQLLDTRPLARFPFTGLSFPQLTALHITRPLRDAELELLLPACPQLLTLDCTVWQSAQVLLLAARCCPNLLQLAARTRVDLNMERRSVVAQCQPSISGLLLPQLVSLTLCDGGELGSSISICDWSVLRLFTSPPHAQLRQVCLDGRELTALHVMSLACLPQLSHLQAHTQLVQDGLIDELEEASSLTEQRLLLPLTSGRKGRHARAPTAGRERCDGNVQPPPLGPHQRQEMRQRVLDAAEAAGSQRDNLLSGVESPDGPTAREIFFAELQSILTKAERAEKARRGGRA